MTTELISASPRNLDTGFVTGTCNYSQPPGLAQMAAIFHGRRKRVPYRWNA
jgi:hypothetical protein